MLDEPTNDLDIETLDLLEELLVEYDGTLLLVSHDRTFLDRVVTSSLVFEGDGVVNEYVGGYSDWLRQRKSRDGDKARTAEKSSARRDKSRRSAAKLSYKDQRELDQLPQRIEQLEKEIDQIHTHMADSAFYRLPGEVIAARKEQLSAMEAELQTAYRRWEELER